MIEKLPIKILSPLPPVLENIDAPLLSWPFYFRDPFSQLEFSFIILQNVTKISSDIHAPFFDRTMFCINSLQSTG